MNMLVLTDFTFIVVMLGTALVGITSGALGCFAFLRKQSLLGDAISHAALPGIAVMFLFTHSKNQLVLLTGGGIAGIIGTILMAIVVRYTALKKDAILGIVLSVFFGFGLVLMTVIQKYSIAQQSILNKFLFGNAATILPADVYLLSVIACIVLLSLFFIFKESKLLIFDTVFFQTLGYRVWVTETIITVLLVLTILIGLQTVGVVLMSSMLIAPAAAARQWTSRLGYMVVLAATFGGMSSVIGAIMSSTIDKLPTGPAIVVVLSLFVFFSLLFAPHRGVFFERMKARAQ